MTDYLSDIEARRVPHVDVPAAPADDLIINDLVEGTGKEVGPNATVTVHYIGVGQQSGQAFDSSWSRNDPISFGLNQVIEGWTKGMVGMKEGGRRELIIPGSMAYGNRPPTPAIGRDETLVFVIDLIETT